MIRLRRILLLLSPLLLLQGCGDPSVNAAEQLEGSWRTYFQPQVVYESDHCHGTLAPVATETWEVYWDIKALNTREVDIRMSWFASNFIITDFSCGSSTGLFPEQNPIEHIYGYIDNGHLILSETFSGAGGNKVISGDLRFFSRNLEGVFYLDTYFGSEIIQSVYMSGQGLQLERY